MAADSPRIKADRRRRGSQCCGGDECRDTDKCRWHRHREEEYPRGRLPEIFGGQPNDRMWPIRVYRESVAKRPVAGVNAASQRSRRWPRGGQPCASLQTPGLAGPSQSRDVRMRASKTTAPVPPHGVGRALSAPPRGAMQAATRTRGWMKLTVTHASRR